MTLEFIFFLFFFQNDIANTPAEQMERRVIFCYIGMKMIATCYLVWVLLRQREKGHY